MKTFVVRVAVLHDERLHAFRVLERETLSNGRTIIHYVEGVLGEL